MDMTPIITGLLLGLALVLAWRLAERLIWPVGTIEPEALKKRLDRREDLLLLDVRTEREFTGEDGHIRGAVNVALSDIGDRLKKAKGELASHAEEPVIVVCRSGGRSTQAARKLKRAGITNVSVLSGGMKAWNAKGYPKRR
ncbi:MAG: hypothetical protein GVY28_01320 [Alphaproteobacteria bacterium]|jgi:rhodanese-related sulfurtransferase|nr:hypothetical protein [Alphaproteobacteria bacterium]